MRARILTVLRSGGEYRSEHVERLRQQCAEHAPGVQFDCLTEGAGLESDWPGWWAKIECFRVPGPVLYMDLDTTVLGSLEPLLQAAEQNDFIALRDFNPNQREMGSGLMAWRGDMSHLLREFERDPTEHMARCTTPRYWGDQGFIEPLTKGRAYWQDVVPGAVVSFKKHCAEGVPRGARVVCFHGKPRPWEVKGRARG
ncbi:MAG: hypothetical protein KDI69_03285 [Xanthomonadales bacterium]|nr:hypothetical protein [Xanthomonadales bacterium]